MIKYENDCVSCEFIGQQCLGKLCPYKNVPHYYCDNCNEEEVLYHFNDSQLCINCIENKLTKVVAKE